MATKTKNQQETSMQINELRKQVRCLHRKLHNERNRRHYILIAGERYLEISRLCEIMMNARDNGNSQEVKQYADSLLFCIRCYRESIPAYVRRDIKGIEDVIEENAQFLLETLSPEDIK